MDCLCLKTKDLFQPFSLQTKGKIVLKAKNSRIVSTIYDGLRRTKSPKRPEMRVSTSRNIES